MQINLIEYLISSAKKYKDKIAFCDDTSSLTFGELLEKVRSNGIYLSQLLSGAKNQPVFVAVERDIDTLVNFFSVLWSGNFYVPIDINVPDERIYIMHETIKPVLFICRNSEADRLKAQGLEHICVMPDNSDKNVTDERGNYLKNIDTDPAYVIFTSGSTGIPKGVVISHRAVTDLTEWLTECFSFDENDIIGNQTPFFFDASVKDIYLTLKNGCTMYILKRQLFSAPVNLVDFLNEKKVNTILWATSAIKLFSSLDVFSAAKPIYLKKIFFAGENMSAKHYNYWKRHLQNTLYVNLYGPTEITVDCAYYIVPREFPDNENIPIGFACRNMEIFLLDENLCDVRDGETGELYVRGTGTSFGYYNNPEQSDQAFIQNPKNTSYREYIYKTGDLAKKNEYGELLFISRHDNQVKHMGNRIELGEIETAAVSVEGVSGAVCFYDQDKEKIILVCESFSVRAQSIAALIGATLPKYMMPGKLFVLDKLPETNNGKADRAKIKRDYFDGNI